MLKIRLQLLGRKKQPFYRIVVAEARSRRGGKATEIIGHFNPFSKEFACKADRYELWIKRGAQPTDTVKALVSKHGLLVKKEMVKSVNDTRPPIIVPPYRPNPSPPLPPKKEDDADKQNES